MLKAFEHARQCSERVDQIVAEFRRPIPRQVADKVFQELFVFRQFRMRLRVLVVAMTRIIICR